MRLQRRLFHHDGPRALQMRNQPLSGDLRHVLVGRSRPLAALEAKRKRQPVPQSHRSSQDGAERHLACADRSEGNVILALPKAPRLAWEARHERTLQTGECLGNS